MNVGSPIAGTAGGEAEEESIRCPGCGLTTADLRGQSLFGCPQCYETFAKNLDPLLKRVHGAVRHRGRIPGGAVAPPADTRALRRELATAIRDEDFERAARLRDRLREAGHPEEDLPGDAP